jgi:predicted component of type VI protein secretion system
MERRAVLATLGSLVALPGCVSDAPDRSTETEPETATDRSTETTTERNTETGRETTPEECGWPEFCEGSKLVEVTVSSRFSGSVVLEAGCRDEDVEMRPGETKTLERQVDAETCDVALYVDDRKAYADTIQSYESTTLRVDSGGNVHAETVEL